MSHYAIAISRQFGSMGRSIAHKLSDILEIEYLDRDIVEETSKRMGLPVSMISAEEEVAKMGFFGRAYPLGSGMPSLRDDIFMVQKNIILDFAKKESCIIVGRCADEILKEQENLLSVYIYAPYEQRLKNCTEILGMDEKTAARLMKEVDVARENYHKTYVPGYKSPFHGRNLCLDSSYFGIEGTAELIAKIAREKFLC